MMNSKRPKLKNMPRDYYCLKGSLTDVQLEKGSNRLVLVFQKWNDPEYSAERLRGLEGFVLCSFKKAKHTTDRKKQGQRHGDDTKLPAWTNESKAPEQGFMQEKACFESVSLQGRD